MTSLYFITNFVNQGASISLHYLLFDVSLQLNNEYPFDEYQRYNKIFKILEDTVHSCELTSDTWPKN
jgi:hypothetical protein